MNTPVKNDPLLEPFLTELDDSKTDELLLQLINAHIEPVIKGVIRSKLRLSSHSATQHAEAEDIHQEAVLQLLAQLREFRKAADTHPISDVRGMAAVIAHRTCSGWMRRQFPERHALKNRLHYLLTRQRGLALWQDDDGKMLAGFAVWQEQKRAVARQSPSNIETSISRKQNKLADTVAAILNHARAPLEF